MAVTRQPRAYTFTAVNEGVELPHKMYVTGMTFRGTGLTATDRLEVRDHATPGSGSLLADYLVEGATDNGDLWAGREPQIVSGLSVTNAAVNGTWQLTVFVRD